MKKVVVVAFMLISMSAFSQKNSFGNDQHNSFKSFVQVYTTATGFTHLDEARVKEMIERSRFGYVKITPELEEFVQEPGLKSTAPINKRGEVEINMENMPFILDIFRIADIETFIYRMQHQ